MANVKFDDLIGADLVIDATYESDRTLSGGSVAGEPLNRLMGVGNLGGFRTKRGRNGIQFAVITSTGVEAEWPDSLDPHTGIYTYFGDNRQPGADMHKTKQRGNALLRDSFEYAHSDSFEGRAKCPVYFIFEWAGKARDVVFRGMAVPGSEYLAPGEDLVAVWRTVGGQRFQNYRASFTVLNESVIDGGWFRNSLSQGEFLLDDTRAPKSLVKWFKQGKLSPLLAEKIGTRTVPEQLPQNSGQQRLIDEICKACSDDPWTFEKVAAEIWKLSSSAPVSYQLTPRSRDGGRDAIGEIQIGPASDPILLPFALEAKLYSRSNRVGVKEVSRLISRIKHRDFGVLVTTSALNSQAYKEVREDQHPIIVISGRDIAEILAANGITTAEQCQAWLGRILA